ncbi:tumor protein D53-like [Leptonychotes weddellii]|uniref:Tumor protein D53-like n=1 Tax=Leptonychotes weddellii TaxID=9713 RepID=A0A7F8RJK7_LEPWE|nr:tumor protein D53-like [Leptonychotes weddellii]
MEAQAQGLLETEPLQGRDEDTVASADFSSMLSEEEREELKAELVQLFFCYFRNSPTFKSFEERVETTVTSLKTKVGGANHGGGSFEEVLSSTAHASAQSSGGGPRRAEEEELQC